MMVFLITFSTVLFSKLFTWKEIPGKERKEFPAENLGKERLYKSSGKTNTLLKIHLWAWFSQVLLSTFSMTVFVKARLGIRWNVRFELFRNSLRLFNRIVDFSPKLTWCRSNLLIAFGFQKFLVFGTFMALFSRHFWSNITCSGRKVTTKDR